MEEASQHAIPFTTPQVLKWWRHKRLKYNKALLFTGLMGFVAQAVQPAFKINDTGSIEHLLSNMRLSATCLTAMLVLSNIAFTAGCILDLAINFKNSQSFREWLFFIGYRFTIGVLISLIIGFLWQQ